LKVKSQARLDKDVADKLIKEYEKAKTQITVMNKLNKTLQDQFDKLYLELNPKVEEVVVEKEINKTEAEAEEESKEINGNDLHKGEEKLNDEQVHNKEELEEKVNMENASNHVEAEESIKLNEEK